MWRPLYQLSQWAPRSSGPCLAINLWIEINRSLWLTHIHHTEHKKFTWDSIRPGPWGERFRLEEGLWYTSVNELSKDAAIPTHHSKRPLFFLMVFFSLLGGGGYTDDDDPVRWTPLIWNMSIILNEWGFVPNVQGREICPFSKYHNSIHLICICFYTLL